MQQRIVGYIIGSLFFLWGNFAALLYSGDQTIEQETRNIVLQDYPELQKIPFVLVLVSTHHCTECAAAATNGIIARIHQQRPSFPCVVAVIANNILDVTTIRDNFHTPAVVADTLVAHRTYLAHHSSDLPLLVVFDSTGKVVYSQKDIQHNQPDYTALLSGVTATQTIELLPHKKALYSIETTAPQVNSNEILLEQPSSRSISALGPPVIAGSVLVGVNFLTGHLESWDISTGTLLQETKVPDTATYFYRNRENALLWKQAEAQGYHTSRFEAVTAIGDTIYALARVLAHYTKKLVPGQSTTDSVYSVDWQPGQIIVRMERGTVKNIIPVPDGYGLYDLIADGNGYIGGVCNNVFGADKSAGDSLPFFMMIDSRETKPNDLGGTRIWKTANTGNIISAGAKATIPSGTIWYCDPIRQQFLLLRPDGTRDSIVPHGALQKSGSSIMLVSQPSNTTEQFHFSYILDNMIAIDDTLSMLLIPEKPSSGLPCLLQSYTTTGAFLGERALDIPAAQEALWIHLLAIEDGRATILLNTVDKRWHIRHIALPTPTLHSESLR